VTHNNLFKPKPLRGLIQALALMRRIAILLLLTASLATFAGDFDYDAYEPIVLADLVAATSVDPRADYYFDVALPRFQSTVAFTGRTRAISSDGKDFIAHWAYATKLPASYPDLFQDEVEVKQGNDSYWMPIQQSLLEDFAKEILPGNNVHLYISFLGEFKHAPVFAISGFKSREG
jgi:hypothetical protein